jgi:hypothetical protein
VDEPPAAAAANTTVSVARQVSRARCSCS